MRQPQRQLESAVRQRVVNLVTDITAQGATHLQAAEFLNVPPRTLRQWQADCRLPTMPCSLLGRPLQRAHVHDRNDVIALLDDLGPATGLPTLRDCFPDLARAELEDILARYRRVWQKLNLEVQHRLRWTSPGTIWAVDFTYAPAPVEGRYPYLLAVRDLASGKQLLWQPVLDMTACTAQNALATLFLRYQPPLVLKMDNGSAFIAEALQNLLMPEVTPLFSPAYYPRYNGAIEAGIGSLKTRTSDQATRNGHPGYWTLDDVAAAQADANYSARPRGPSGPSPEQLWDHRTYLTVDERLRFQTTLQQRRLENLLTLGSSMSPTLVTKELRSLERKAISQALVEHGYLLFSRRRIPLPISSRKAANI
jgi:putative transposase